MAKRRVNVDDGLRQRKRNQLIFYISLVILPSIQFALFYIYVNFNSILLSFQTFDVESYSYSFAGFANFKAVFDSFSTSLGIKSAVGNSLIVYAFTFLVGLPLAVIFSFYIYKQKVLSGAFKVILFMPSIVSGVVLVIIFRYFMGYSFPIFVQKVFGLEELPRSLLARPETRFGTVLFYSIFMGFGTQVLLYVGTMSGISDSVIEAGKLDGIKPFKELIFIVVPLIFSTITTFIVVGVAAIFTNQMSLFSFYNTDAPEELWTFGYFLYKEAKTATYGVDYTELAAWGLVLTFICAPITIGLRVALNKVNEKCF